MNWANRPLRGGTDTVERRDGQSDLGGAFLHVEGEELAAVALLVDHGLHFASGVRPVGQAQHISFKLVRLQAGVRQPAEALQTRPHLVQFKSAGERRLVLGSHGQFPFVAQEDACVALPEHPQPVAVGTGRLRRQATRPATTARVILPATSGTHDSVYPLSTPIPPANRPEPTPSAVIPPMMGAAQQAAQAAPAPRTSFQGFMFQLSDARASPPHRAR